MSIKIDKAAIVGEWILDHFEETGPHGELIQSHPDSHGLLIYTASGYMSVAMNRKIESLDEDIQRNFVRHLYYAGKFGIQDEFILHKPELAILDHHRGKILPRRAYLSEAGRILTLEALSSESKVLGKIVWRRM